METGICIRKAELQDTDDLFWLLHSASIPKTKDEIRGEMSDIYVMTRDDLLLGATLNAGGWTAIHPMYPEGTLTGILRDSLESLHLRNTTYRLTLCRA